jgi:hypothetical protein
MAEKTGRIHRAVLGTTTALFVGAVPPQAIAAGVAAPGTDGGPQPVAVAPLEPTTTTTADVPPLPDERAAPTRKYAWGRHRPIPARKIAGLASTAGLTAVFLGAAIGSTVALQFTYRKKLLKAVDDSQTDSNPNNDIDRSEPNLCDAARDTPPGEPNPNKVTNAAVTRICNQADGLRITQNAMWAMTAVGLAATAVFTVLLFVRRPDKERRVSLRMGGMPGRFMLGLGGRF